MMQKIGVLIIILVSSCIAQAQELNARVTVVSSRVGNTVPKNTFVTLQSALTNFLNTRKWSNENYAAAEKIDCNFLLNLEQGEEPNVYKAKLTVQAARPVFNSSYISPIINYQDDNILFKYAEFQQLEFNESRVSGSDPLISNLTAIMAFYAHVIIAFDNASFSSRGGGITISKGPKHY